VDERARLVVRERKRTGAFDRAAIAVITLHWYPGITFWQTAVDQVFATGVPAGHGHVYGSSVVEGWAAPAAPPGWTTAGTVRLRAVLDNRSER
jgi:uncharacterized membrane protein